jgi:hypothetical protein
MNTATAIRAHDVLLSQWLQKTDLCGHCIPAS